MTIVKKEKRTEGSQVQDAQQQRVEPWYYPQQATKTPQKPKNFKVLTSSGPVVAQEWRPSITLHFCALCFFFFFIYKKKKTLRMFRRT